MASVTSAAEDVAHEGGSRLKRAGMYLKAHWKELLALVLAAIPAAYIVFHKQTQQAVTAPLQSLLSNVPGGAGSPGVPGPSGGGDPSTSIGTPAPVASAGSLGTSVNGSNPVRVAAPAQSSGTVFQRVMGTPQARATAPAPAPKTTIGSAFAGVPILGNVLKNFGPANLPPGTTAQSYVQSNYGAALKNVPLIGNVLGTPAPSAPPVPIKSLPLNPRRSSGNQAIQ